MLFRIVLFLIALCMVTPLQAKDYLVRNQQEYFEISKKLVAGDIVTLADGTWRDFEIKLSANGTKKRPILLRAQTAGKVIISGQSNLRIGGQYITVSGLVFRDGFSPTGEVISFRRSKSDLAFNSRITEVVIDHFNKPDRYDNDYWVGIYGKNNRFDHNNLVGKSNKGVTLAVRLDSEDSRENGHHIDHNYFGPRPVLGSNGGETLRVGTSHYSMFNSNTVIEDNIFERTDGEVEIISIKSAANIVRRNLFVEASGAVVLRHGDYNIVERNVFLGKGKDHTGGIRVINGHQTIRGNYMEGLRGDGFASALTVMNGVPNSPVNRYVQVSNAKIENNSILNSSIITLAAGADAERSAAPIDSVMAKNIFTGGESGPEFIIQDDIGGIKFADNALVGERAAYHPEGIAKANFGLRRAENGLLYPDNPKYAGIGAPRDPKLVKRDEVGAKWYPKPAAGDKFGTGAVIAVAADEGALFAALSKAKDGDILALSSGEHIANKTLSLDKAITIRGAADEAGKRGSAILFDRPTLFEIAEGGSLRLEMVKIDGKLAPDSVGNSMIRTTIYPMQTNFMIEMDKVTVKNLSVNKSFDVIKLGKSSFADRVTIGDSKFKDITGSVLSAAAETEDYGQYNAEYVDIAHSKFKNIGGPIINLYRGGRDESTFGPHFSLVKSSLENVGKSGNNASGASVLLHGVQYTDISENRIVESAPIHVKHTVGTPKTRIAKNSFAATPEIQISELNYKGGKQRAMLSDNEYEQGGAK